MLSSVVGLVPGGGEINAIGDALSGLTGGNKHEQAEFKHLIDDYNRAIAGDPSGIADIQAWIATVPPHPNKTVALARKLLAQYQARGGGSAGMYGSGATIDGAGAYGIGQARHDGPAGPTNPSLYLQGMVPGGGLESIVTGAEHGQIVPLILVAALIFVGVKIAKAA